MDDTTKVCSTCGEMRPLGEFEKWRRECKRCRQARQKIHNQRPEVKARKREWMRLYYARNQKVWRDKTNAARVGITEADYLEVLHEQDGRCAICGLLPTIGARSKGPDKFARLHIDHDHETKQFRGLLCHLCNIGLGHFKDDPELLQKAIQYLRQER